MIEIEKKFLLTADEQRALLDGANAHGEKLVEDSYFDTDDYQLTSKNFWFRERDGVYELKAPLQSTSQTNATNRYDEITDIEGISQKLNLPLGDDFPAIIAAAGIKKFVTCYTVRNSYEKAGFHIDVDKATYLGSAFEYAVAEIELLIDDESQADDAESRIITFAKQFDLTTDQKIIGKIGAYLKVEKPEHYQLLINAGVF